MTRNLTPLIWIALVAVMAPACSWIGDREPVYLGAEEGKPLQVPPGLDQPRPLRPVVIGVEEMRKPNLDELNPLPPRAAVTAGGGEANAYLAWSASGAYLAVKDTPRSVGRRLRYAIQRSGMNLQEISDQGAHRFDYQHVREPRERGFFEKMMFWRESLGPDYSGTYVVRLQEDGKETRVYLVTPEGAPASTNAAEHILGIFMERLG